MKINGRFLCAAGFASLLLLNTLHAQTEGTTGSVPRLVKFSGTLHPGAPRPDGPVGVEFAVYAEQTGGVALWSEIQNVDIDGAGSYSVFLGSTKNGGLPPQVLGTGDARWLAVTPLGGVEEPRVRLVSVPYALRAEEALRVAGVPAGEIVRKADLTETVRETIRTMPPVSSHPNADSNASSGPTTFTGDTTTQIVTVQQTGTGKAIVAIASSGVAAAATGGKGGVAGTATQAGGIGVQGNANSSTGSGVFGINSATTGTAFGVSGQTGSTTINAAGVNGFESATSGQVYGVNGNTSSAGAYAAGVNGYASATSGQVFGVAGTSNSAGTGAAGVNGNAISATGQVYGVSGNSNSNTTNAAGVNGIATATSGQTYGVNGSNSSTGPFAAGVNGYEGAATGQVAGVAGSTASTGSGSAGVTGNESATTGQVYGVSGNSASTTVNAAGVFGYENASTGQVYGVSGNTGSAGPLAAGVVGNATSNTGEVAGLDGNAQSTTNGASGVVGNESAKTGQVYGVYGQTASTSSFAAGVSGFASGTTGNIFGVTGSTNSSTSGASALNGYEGATSGGPVYGLSAYAASTNGIGAFGSALATSGFAVGVEGATASPGGTAGQFVNTSGSGSILLGQSGASYTTVFSVDAAGNGTFAGNLNVTGRVTKGSGSFKIDHPLDPANKYLSHSFVESPDMKDVYDGVIQLNARGEAWVTLPDYFEALNEDFRYQLTAVGAPAPRLYVAREVSHNRFQIAGGRPGGKVSWQVTGIRHDAYATANRIQVTEEKPATEQGRYLHPEVFGKSEDLRVGAGQPANARMARTQRAAQ